MIKLILLNFTQFLLLISYEKMIEFSGRRKFSKSCYTLS